MANLRKIISFNLERIDNVGERRYCFVFLKETSQLKLFFTGFVFNTKRSAIHHKVIEISESRILGFLAFTELRKHSLNTDDYIQLFIKMEGTNENEKIEIIAAVKKESIEILNS